MKIYESVLVASVMLIGLFMSAGCSNDDSSAVASLGSVEKEMSATAISEDVDSNTDSSPLLHVFLLLGQSNMAGYALAEDSDKIPDDRILMLGYDSGCGREGNKWAVAQPPLHDYINDCEVKVSPGDWFAKTLVEMLPRDGARIGLVPAAFSGKKIETFMQGGEHHRAIVQKIEIAAQAENARFEGILFHQGESNNGDPNWPGNVKMLYDQLKPAMGINDDIPFIAGELLYSGGAAGHNELVRRIPEQGDNFHYVSAEGLMVDSADSRWNLHFGHEITVELGKRYAVKMAEVLGW